MSVTFSQTDKAQIKYRCVIQRETSEIEFAFVLINLLCGIQVFFKQLSIGAVKCSLIIEWGKWNKTHSSRTAMIHTMSS